MATLRFGGEPLPGLPFIHSGKVRDSYGSTTDPGQRFVVASDRISVFDHVLNAQVPRKGEVLTAMNVFWRNFFAGDCNHDLLAYGLEIDRYLPPHLRGNSDLQKRAVVVSSQKMHPIEAVVRGYLTGSAVKGYLATGSVWGHRVPMGLYDGAKFPTPIFTPTTKEELGHDKPIPIDEFRSTYGKLGQQIENLSLFLYGKAYRFAEERGIIIVDTKYEFGRPKTLSDEVLTPDSSRYWLKMQWEAANREQKVPAAFDKQYVRNWAREFGVDKLDPENPAHVEQVRQLVVPQIVLDETTRLYLEIFELLVGKTLEQFQREDMHIAA